MKAILRLISKYGGTLPQKTGQGGSTAKGMTPRGARVPSTGDGRTTTNRKVKVTEQPAQPVKRHRK